MQSIIVCLNQRFIHLFIQLLTSDYDCYCKNIIKNFRLVVFRLVYLQIINHTRILTHNVKQSCVA